MITPSGRPISLTIDDSSMVGEARRAASVLAGRLGFDETGRGKVAIVTTEAATNLAKHARGGEILIQGIECGAIAGIDILALDRGPGMPDVDRCLVDGYSTAGSPGVGLGAMARLSACFDIHSLAGHGTAVLSRLWSQPWHSCGPAAGLEFGAINLPLAGEEVCGDTWAIAESEGRSLIILADGLGHGPQAAEAAREGIHAFRERSDSDPGEIIRAAHVALKPTRGAAVAIARIDPPRGEVRYAGVGNVAGIILNPGEETGRISMVSNNGTVGHMVRKVQEFTYPWAAGSQLVMHSDGVGSHWLIGRQFGLGMRHPGLLAGVIYRDFRRIRDDVTVVVAREGVEDRA